MRQPGEEQILRSYAVTHGPGSLRFPQDRTWHQLVHASSGVVRINTGRGSWTLPPERGLWIAAGVEHDTVVVQRAAMRTLYLPAEWPLLDDEVTVVEMTPLVRALVLRLVERAPVDLDASGRAWATVLREEVRSLEVAPVSLPAVAGEPAATVARLLQEDPGRSETLEQLSSAAGASRRTVERSFRAQTGVSIAAWRRRLRLLVALEQLATGRPIGRVAVDAGYASQSSFGAMFRREFGSSPGQYFDHRSEGA